MIRQNGWLATTRSIPDVPVHPAEQQGGAADTIISPPRRQPTIDADGTVHGVTDLGTE